MIRNLPHGIRCVFFSHEPGHRSFIRFRAFRETGSESQQLYLKYWMTDEEMHAVLLQLVAIRNAFYERHDKLMHRLVVNEYIPTPAEFVAYLSSKIGGERPWATNPRVKQPDPPHPSVIQAQADVGAVLARYGVRQFTDQLGSMHL